MQCQEMALLLRKHDDGTWPMQEVLHYQELTLLLLLQVLQEVQRHSL